MAKKEKAPVAIDLMTERTAKAIVKAFREIDEAYQVEGMHTRPVMTDDGYRQKPLDPNSEFFIGGYWIGAKGQIVFKAVPVDSKPYQWADIDEKAMDNVFPLAGPAVAEKLGIEEEDFTEIVRVMRTRIAQEDADKKAAEQKAAAEDAVAYEKLPSFGRF